MFSQTKAWHSYRQVATQTASPGQLVLLLFNGIIRFLEQARLGFAIPADFPAMQTENPALALEWRTHSRAVLDHYLARGYRLTDFDAPTKQYLLERGEKTP